MKTAYLKDLPKPRDVGFRKLARDLADKKPGHWALVYEGDQKSLTKKRCNIHPLKAEGYDIAQRSADGKYGLYVRKEGKKRARAN